MLLILLSLLFYKHFIILLTTKNIEIWHGQTIFISRPFSFWLVAEMWFWSQVSGLSVQSPQRALVAQSIFKQCWVLLAKNISSPHASLLIYKGMALKGLRSHPQRNRRIYMSIKTNAHTTPLVENSALLCFFQVYTWALPHRHQLGETK